MFEHDVFQDRFACGPIVNVMSNGSRHHEASNMFYLLSYCMSASSVPGGETPVQTVASVWVMTS